MKSSKDILLLLVVLIGAAGAGMWVLQMDVQVTPAQVTGEVEVSGDEYSPLLYQPNREGSDTVGMQNEQIKRAFEGIVNGFLADLETRLLQYRQKRQTLRDVMKPQSMREYDYVQENDIFARTLMAEMDVEIETVVRQFEETDIEMRELLGRMNPEDASALLAEWDRTKSTQLSQYERFFEQERRIFDLYRIILEVYTVSGGAYKVNPAGDTTNFEDRQLQGAYEDAQRSVAEILSRRSEL